ATGLVLAAVLATTTAATPLSPNDTWVVVSVCVLAAVTLTYTWLGGMRAVVWMDVVQLGLYLTGQSLNIYSQVALIMLVGLAAKNGILLVEFTNQLRDDGVEFEEAISKAAEQRLRPIIMTAITTIMGAIPLLLAFGAGSESRYVIGVVVVSGVSAATLFTLFVVPMAYRFLARHTGSPQDVAHQLEKELKDSPAGN
uniref:efflux RND transporter permease subunit n=1 Tax=uncultured Spongiibacter sp. TaxID=870896 RepID=UPI002582B80D